MHSIGAWVSLAGLSLLGPRLGRYTAEGKLRSFPASSIPMAVLGVLILWLGWWGFNGGSTLAFNGEVGKIILNTNLAGAAAGLAAYFHSYFVQQKDSIYEKMLGGILGGLVAITASPHIQTPLTSLVIGLAAGIIHNLAYDFVAKKLKIDDAVGAIPVHGFCGAFGTLAVVLAPASTLANGFWLQLGIQAMGVVLCFVWAGGLAYAMFFVLRRTIGLRVSPAGRARRTYPVPERAGGRTGGGCGPGSSVTTNGGIIPSDMNEYIKETNIAQVAVKQSDTDFEVMSLLQFLKINALERNKLVMAKRVEFVDFEGNKISILSALTAITALMAKLRADNQLVTALKS
ncbi:Ammonium Transporter Family [Catalinimonas alkaloidigena]|uniref:Ammonium Transporter Family n=1 Tax=Catalinimonas alkaloidigena TaxID=1075417 RepID=A0A1G9IU85_9BACT|nr:Ammonium Transporter Family [Catalinimonas alkaloidigena]